ncbi:hypothetical protein [Catalinimonas niigatensis]|uniref:hypothetical protein n=1 Tax=Catalinimonas niigatensis TaxID=1397264 RepID=UPI002665DCE2|nr:hypothetical protein [Catalinimonas niigatensis]WPP53010.1 hypothetical protein PZB72_11550 [Catalinimonas niigatensis]
MNRFRKIFRQIRLALLIILISLGVGLAGAGPIFPNSRERYMDKEIRTEQVDKKEEESDIEYNEVIE